MPLIRTSLLPTLLLLLPALALAQPAHRSPPPRTVPATIYVAPTGNDANTCTQAQQQGTAKRTINAGLACVPPGGTVALADGTYDELLVGQVDSSRTCQSSLAAIQTPCHALPNGPSPEQPTSLVAPGGNAVVSPRGRDFPGGGGIVTLFDTSRHLHFEGLKFLTDEAPGSASGFVGGNAQYVTLTRSELDNGAIKSSSASRGFTITHNHVHHVKPDCMPEGQKPTPSACPHALYMCGTDHVITDNLLEYGGYYALHISCESGGIARINIERNTIRHFAGAGIRCAGEDCLVASNLLVSNGQGISLTGSGVVAHNTIAGFQAAAWNPDPTGIWTTWGDGSGFQIINNILTGFPNSYLLIGNAAGAPANQSKVHHNLTDTPGNAGATLIGSPAQVYANPSQGDYTLRKARDNPAIGAGVPVAEVPTDIRGRTFHEVTPSVGAYALDLPTPEPPTPGGPLVLLCEGAIRDQGKLEMRCVQQISR